MAATQTQDLGRILDRLRTALEQTEPADLAELDELVRHTITVGMLSRLFEANAPSLAAAFALGREQGEALCATLRRCGVDDLAGALLSRRRAA